MNEFVSQKTTLMEQHDGEGTAVKSVKWLQHRNGHNLTAKAPIHLLKSATVRAYFSIQDMWKHHNARTIVIFANVKCVFGKDFYYFI